MKMATKNAVLRWAPAACNQSVYSHWNRKAVNHIQCRCIQQRVRCVFSAEDRLTCQRCQEQKVACVLSQATQRRQQGHKVTLHEVSPLHPDSIDSCEKEAVFDSMELFLEGDERSTSDDGTIGDVQRNTILASASRSVLYFQEQQAGTEKSPSTKKTCLSWETCRRACSESVAQWLGKDLVESEVCRAHSPQNTLVNVERRRDFKKPAVS